MKKVLRNDYELTCFKRSSIVFLCLLLFSLYSSPLLASLAKDMDRYFASAGTFANTTPPQVWKDQASGGFTGGGLFIRPQSRYVQPITVTPPNLSMGCGIDFYSGGLGYIQAKEMIKVIRQIGSEMPYFAAQLMLATVSPEINNVVKNIQAIVQKINELGVNQCDTARKLAAAVYPKQQHASEMACRWMGSDEGLVTDFIKAKHQCNQGGEQEKVLKKLATNSKYKNLLIGDYNLVYRILKNSPLWESYQGLAEFLMSLTGTIVNTIEQGVAISRLKDSLLDQGDSAGLLKQILYGSEETNSAKVYKCLDEECLKMGVSDARIPKEQSSMGKISKIVMTLQEKHLADEGVLTDAEKAILETTSAPLLKILTINSIRKTELVTLDEATLETIAKDFLIHYLDELVGLVEKELAHFRDVQFSSEGMDRLRDNIRAVKQVLRTLETRFFENMSRTHMLRTQVTQEEDRLMRMIMMTE